MAVKGEKTIDLLTKRQLFQWDKLPLLLIILLFLAPILAGGLGSLLPAFGYFPGLGSQSFSLTAWHQFLDYPGIFDAVSLSFWVGIGAASSAFILTNIFCAAFYNRRFFNWIRRGLGPLLSVPHVSIAIGMLFLLAPSGWLFRLFSPWLTGIERPLDIAIFPDSYGLSLMLVLVVKEIPFLLMVTIGAMNEIPTRRSFKIAESMGYGRIATWVKIILPQLYGRIRLPMLAVLVFSVSVVDMALVLLPGNSPNLAMLILRWYNDPDLGFQFLAAMGAMAQTILAVGAILLWFALEKISSHLVSSFTRGGSRFLGNAFLEKAIEKLSVIIATIILCFGVLSTVLLLIWSFAGRWQFPNAIPQKWSTRFWDRHLENILEVFGNSVLLASTSALVAVALSIACLEVQKRQGLKFTNQMPLLLYVPLLVPQVAFLFGIQLLSVWGRIDGAYITVIWGHLLFVLPYTFLSLVGPYQAFDSRYTHTACMLGKSELYVFFKIKLAMLLRPILVAFAVGFAVSITQYLPTLFLGAGRINSLATEAISLSSGGDRRVVGIYAFLQAVLPFIAFAIATIFPMWIYRNRLNMRGNL